MPIKKVIRNGIEKYELRIEVVSRETGERVSRRRQFSSEKEAKKFEKKMIVEAQTELCIRDQKGASWGKLLEMFDEALLREQNISPQRQRVTNEDMIKTLIQYTSHWKSLSAASITTADINEIIQTMQAQSLSYSRQKAVKAAINQVFQWGIVNRKIRGVSQSPTVGVYLKKGAEKRPDILNINEIRTLLLRAQQLGHEWYPVWVTALLTGMRSGELYALLWSDVDLDNKIIRVTKSYNCRLDITKTTKGNYWRDIPINTELDSFLKRLKIASNSEYVLPRINDWKRSESARILRTFCHSIGITPIKFHALRACFATQLLKGGLAPAIVMKVCGWKGLETMQCYVRLAGIEIKDATISLEFMPPNHALQKVLDFMPSQ